MKFAYTGRKLDVTEAMKLYTEKRLSRLDRYFQNDSLASVTYHTERGRFTAEVTVRCANMLFRAQCTADDMYIAIDGLEERLERQILKNKTRLEKRLRAGAFEREIPPQEYEPEEAYELIRRKRFQLKPMDVEEAILQMNLLDHSFFVFQNSQDNNRFCVVYRRQDGGYGLIESE